MFNSTLQKSRDRSPRVGIGLMLLCLVALCPGCGEPRAAAVNVELAKSTLISVLEHWKAGGQPVDLRQREPEIVVQENDWSQGRGLQAFALIQDGRAEDANWFCEVELTLAPAGSGDPVKKTVTYVVGTDPVITVFRAIL